MFTTVSIPQPSEKLGHIVCSMVVDVQDGRGLLRDSPHWFQLMHIEGTCTAISQNLGSAHFSTFFARGPRKGKADADPSVSTLRPMKGLSW